jgi:hypothetical protein
MTISFNPAVSSVSSYNKNKVQHQSFGRKIPDKFLKACREGSAEYMNRIMDGFPHSYTIEENKKAMEIVIRDPKTKMTQSLKDLADLFGIKI